jgi:hypothetical protein
MRLGIEEHRHEDHEEHDDRDGADEAPAPAAPDLDRFGGGRARHRV